MVLTWQTVITAGAVVAAVAAIIKYMASAHKWVLEQDEQRREQQSMKAELQLLTYGLLAALKGLKEQGCNGPVTEAINKIEKHLNSKAHE